MLTCRPDAPCKLKCYAKKGRFSFQHNKDLLAKNLDIWKNDPHGFECDVTVAAYTARYFRYHSAGEIPDSSYIWMMTRVANRCPYTSFLCFTKKYELVNEFIRDNGIFMVPPNLHLVLSAWGDNFLPDNPYKLPVAYIRLKKEPVTTIPEDAHECSGFCGECVQSGLSCWDLKSGESVVFNEH